jgi:hypothetical protein
LYQNNKELFSQETLTRWKKIEGLVQKQILTNVWCNNCRTSVSISLKSTEMIQEDLVLRGKCKRCEHDVCRVIGAENEQATSAK